MEEHHARGWARNTLHSLLLQPVSQQLQLEIGRHLSLWYAGNVGLYSVDSLGEPVSPAVHTSTGKHVHVNILQPNHRRDSLR